MNRLVWLKYGTKLINIDKVSTIHLDKNRLMFFMSSSSSTANEIIEFDNNTKAIEYFNKINKHILTIDVEDIDK